MSDIVPDPKPPPFEKIRDVRLWVNGDRLFTCGCGNALMTQTEVTLYRCQGCGADYSAKEVT